MALHPVLAEKLEFAVRSMPRLSLTRRDLALPPVEGKVHAVIGMRRAGKTTFLHQLQRQARESSPPECAIYISFDDDRLAELPLQQLGFLLEEYYRRFPALRGKKTVRWYLDEIQLVDGWERFVRRALDSERIEFVVSGSSAKMLSKEIHTSLRGRGMATVVRPFSFREFLRHQGMEPAPPARWTAAERSAIEQRLRDYLDGGGFPEAQGLAPLLRVDLLQGYVDTVLFRDVVERYQVSQVAALRWLARHALRNPAGSFSAYRLTQDLRSQGHSVGKDTVHALLGHLTDAFLLSTAPLATESERQRNTNPRKLYPADPAIIHAFDASGRANRGHALETVVFIELERRRWEVGYCRTSEGNEVDFLAQRPGSRAELIQVCADASNPETLAREVRALDEAKREHPRATARLLVLDRDAASQAPAGAGVQVLPVSEWLLEDE